MHPPLHRPHPDCQDVIQDLIQCHENHPIAKYIGYCNTAKAALDRCFIEEKKKRVRDNPNFLENQLRKHKLKQQQQQQQQNKEEN